MVGSKPAVAGTIMVVDEDPQVRETVCEALARTGYRVLGHDSATSALEQLERSDHRPDLILLDLTRGHGSVGRAFGEAQLRDPALGSIPLVAITERDQTAGVRAEEILHDPVVLERLLSAVNHHVGGEARPPDPIFRDDEHGAQLRSIDWANTALGSTGAWPQSLRTAADLCLGARFASFLVWGPELTLIYNERCGSQIGARHPGSLGRPVREVWPELHPLLCEIMSRGESTDSEATSYNPLRDESGIVRGVLAIDFRAGVEEQLRDRLDQIPLPLCVLKGTDLVFELANATYLQVVGTSDVVGRALRTVCPELRPDTESSLREVMRTGVPVVTMQAGWTFTYAQLLDTTGAGDRIIGIAREVSYRDVEIEELVRTVRTNEMLIGVLGHDLRNPLNAIALAANLLSRRTNTAAIAGPVARILASSDRMVRMVDQLLDFTRIRVGRGIPMEPIEIDLGAVTRRVVEEIETTQGCDIVCQYEGDLVGSWDPDRLEQLLSNLVTNACQHSEPGFPVRVRLDGTDPATVELEVWNRGAVPEALRSVIFDPLRTSSKSSEGKSGLGLGLYISQQVVLAHGGTIELKSTEESGTSFIVRLRRRPRGAGDQAFG